MIRVGLGYDAHPLVKGRRMILCGDHVPFERGPEGWSDGDAPIHALIDALLGAAGLGDIGSHFPPGDPRFKDASSLDLLRQAGEMIRQQGWRAINVDITIIAREPKLGPFVERMRDRLAKALAVGKEQVSVKARSGNGLGFAGEGKGIEAYAVSLLERMPEERPEAQRFAGLRETE